MATRNADGQLELTNQEHSALFHELCVLWERVHGSGPGCFCGTSEELLETVQEYRVKAAQLGDEERE